MNRSWVTAASGSETDPKKPTEKNHSLRYLFGFLIILLLILRASFPAPALAQGVQPGTPTPPGEPPLEAPDRVDVQPQALDEEIGMRLQNILVATGWFINPQVQVQDGVVFLTGQTETQEYKKWAGDLARNTQDVVAVVNQIELTEASIWDVEPAILGLRELWRSMVRALPLVGFSLLILVVAGLIARVTITAARSSLRRRLTNPLLSNVAARTVGIAVFLVGIYIVFYVAGLTSIALTVIGGTGLLGLVLGIAFRDITENFLASIFLSMQNPFQSGDLVEIAGIMGFVQSMTTRATILMTQDGNHVQIPNATVYKSNIHNFTSNPNRRADFIIGIGYEDSISDAQSLALKILDEHPAVLKDPDPWVLVDTLGSATVNLQIYFWLDGSQHSFLKVKSSVIRLTKRAFQQADISMPDESREMLFPDGITVRMVEANGAKLDGASPARRRIPEGSAEAESVSTGAEDGLSSEAGDIKEQARRARTPEDGQNLLDSSPEPDKPSID